MTVNTQQKHKGAQVLQEEQLLLSLDDQSLYNYVRHGFGSLEVKKAIQHGNSDIARRINLLHSIIGVLTKTRSRIITPQLVYVPAWLMEKITVDVHRDGWVLCEGKLTVYYDAPNSATVGQLYGVIPDDVIRQLGDMDLLRPKHPDLTDKEFKIQRALGTTYFQKERVFHGRRLFV